MKVVGLGIIYGRGDKSIASALKVSTTEARRIREQFLGRYPNLRDGIQDAKRNLQDKGYAETVTGMKRYRGDTRPITPWEKRWAVNTIVQGGGAALLKLLLPRVAKFLDELDGGIVLPVFDALVIQFPLGKQDVASKREPRRS